jgi:phosphoribosyl-ATP pyrophosphohydrolase|tara:strand:- start:446 stop:754 length:309 start_codon:yes stop_codon:yes gene_type:complete
MKLEDLVKTINSRADADPSESWTAKLLAQGPEKCAEKFGEEAVEAIIEAVKGDNNALISEAADVIFHYLVMLKSREINFDDVMKELKIRTNKSGLREKEERL